MDRVLQVVPESLRSQFVCNASVQGGLIIYGLEVKVRREISQSATYKYRECHLQVSRVPRLSCKYRECHVYPASIESATCILQVSRVPRTLRVSRVPRTLQISRVPLSGLWSRVQRILRYCNYQERNIICSLVYTVSTDLEEFGIWDLHDASWHRRRPITKRINKLMQL